MAIFSTTASIAAENKKPKIVVVGAGIAGLTAAYRLQQKGLDVHLYEARPRVGGRIFTVKLASHFAELGGQNITDGGEAKHLCSLIKELDLELISHRLSFSQSYFDGEHFTPVEKLLRDRHLDRESLQLKFSTLSKESKNMKEVLGEILEENEPLYKSLAVRLAAYEGGEIEKLSSIYTKTLFYMLLGAIAPVHQDETGNQISVLTVKGGNSALPEKIAEILGNRIHLNKPLKTVSKDAKGSYLLTFQDELVQADLLVLAMPCSVYEGITFGEDVLPQEKLKVIQNIQYGTNAKILLPLRKKPSERIAFINDRVVSFADAAASCLTLYYTGRFSYFSADNIGAVYAQDRAMIEKGFKDAIGPFATPEFARDELYGVYENAVGFSWSNDPYARGSYSYIAAGQEAVLTDIQKSQGELVKTLFAPINDSLYFVGEHASILMDVPGTMEAACESGERVARMILKAHVK